MPSPQQAKMLTKNMTSRNISNLSDNILSQIDREANLSRNPKLIRTEENSMERLTPSKYMQLQSMDTNQKLVRTREMHLPKIIELLDISDTSHQKVSAVDVEEALFQPFPSKISFQSFEPCNVYEVPLHLRNNDKVPRLVKVTQDDSPYFKIISPIDISQKIAPGMTSIFKIQFSPDEKKDYHHELICISEREKFVVSVNAIGARAMLDLPDQVNFGVCPVKHFISKVLYIRNIGNRESQCTVTVKKPFKVSVESIILPVGDGMQLSLEFAPKKVGDYHKDLIIEYSSGEIVYVLLYGASLDANVRLEKSSIRIDNTYIFMTNQRTLTIHNRSNILAKFKWSSYATQCEEDEQKERLCADINIEKNEEHESFLVQCIEDPTLRDQLSILTRTYKTRRQTVEGDPLLFSHYAFEVFPLEGEIWPNSTVDITVVFKPKEVKSFDRTIFCEVTGRESRLPLKIRGEGIGPKLAFSFDSIDIGKIFANSTHSYEVVLSNKGDINAKFCLEVDSTPCPRFCDFQFDPDKGVVLPSEHQSLEITFCSEMLGPFTQDFCFAVNGTHDWLKLTISGNVIGPTFNFDVPRIDFGDVAYGFSCTKICTLFNTSLVPMTFAIRVPEDGAGPSSISNWSDLDDRLLGVDSPCKDGALKEFDVAPAQGAIRSQSEMNIHVTLCSNTIKKYDYSLVVDVKGIGEELLSLPVFANCVVPSIQVLTPVLDFQRCFINYAYQLKAKLLNDTNLCAKYELLPQVQDELQAIVYGSPMPKGLIEPHSTMEIPILFQVHALGEHEVTALFSIFGTHSQCLPCQLLCIGEGPVVHITPSSLDWGRTPVLVSTSKTVKLSNESSIAADYTAQMMRPDSVWKLEPNQGTLEPESVVLITVTATLDDSIIFQDKLTITVIKGSKVTIPVEGQGFGTTIVVDPPISPSINLGPHFAQSKFTQKFKLTNRGRRHQSLAWTTEGFMRRRFRRELGLTASKDMKHRLSSTTPSPPPPVFKLYPTRIALAPGHSAWMTVEGSSDTTRKVSEILLCHAIIGKVQGKDQIIKASVRADFISPVLKMSKKNIRFRIDKHPDDETALTPQTRTFSIKNLSSLPLSCKLTVAYPFQLEGFDGTSQSCLEVILLVEQEIEMTVIFDPAFKDDFVSRVAEGEVSITYLEHPHSDSLALRGEVNFPNLDFSTREVDFGCILNDTEATKFVDMKNSSPLPISYRWSFLVLDGDECIRHIDQIMESESKLSPPNKPSVGSVSALDASVEDPHYISTILDMSSTAEALPNAQLYQEETEEKSLSVKEIRKETDTIASGRETEECDDHLDTEEIENIPLSMNWPKNEMSQEEAEAVERALAEERFRVSSRLSSRHQPSHPIHTRLHELPLLPWLEPGVNHVPQGVEEVFDILPLYGILEAGETQCVTFTYYGHSDVSCNARAICEVQGGPKYEIKLSGEASLIEYNFNMSLIDYGKQMFNQIAVGEIKLENTGRVGFNFIGVSGLSDDDSVAGIPMLLPNSGYVAPFTDLFLKVNYRPGIPEKFHKSFEIQIAHFEPTTINVVGEGVFPRLSLDLPIFTHDEDSYTALLKEARENLENETSKFDRCSSRSSIYNRDKSYDGSPSMDVESFPSEQDIRVEVERLMLKDFASDNRHIFAATGFAMNPSCGLKAKKRKFPRIRLTDYVLDFGHVILGNVRTHIVMATNTSHFPVSFSADRSSLRHTGFCADLDKVKQLPGYPDHETVDFKVTFDPRGANREVGPVRAMMPINILSGPQLCVHLRAHVAVPDLKVSSDTVDFEVVQCGQCKVVTIQLHNEESVRCEWTSISSESNRSLYDKHLPMHLRRKARRESRLRPNHFEMMPAQGFLGPGQRMNIQIKFMPTETKHYAQRMFMQISQSTSRVSIACRGEGQEPRLDFEPNLIEFGPILPHGIGDEMDVTVRNPTPFTAEFYSLNFDKQYLLEEKILRVMKGYDELGNLLLPPRLPGEELPTELIQFYHDEEEKYQATRQKQDKDKLDVNDLAEVDETVCDDVIFANDMKSDELSTMAENVVQNESSSRSSSKKKTESDDLIKSDEMGLDSAIAVGDLEITPVSAAIARHLGIDLSPEGRSARNRRGVVIIVHGPPGSGKTKTSVLLAKTYGAARLTVDDIVLEAISNGNTENGRKARELCMQAGRECQEEEPEGVTLLGMSLDGVPGHAGHSLLGTTETRLGGGTSVVSTKKTSLLSKHGQSSVGSKFGGLRTVSEVTGSQLPSIGIDRPVSRRLSTSASAQDQGLIGCPLPEELLSEIVAERLQLNDCHQGVIFDGLDTMFSLSYQSTVISLLKAINKRKYIYFVSQKLDYFTVRARQRAIEEKKAQCILEEEKIRNNKLEEMDEDEYDALSEEGKEEIERKILERRKLRIKRETEERHLRERLERERMALIEEKRLEEESMRRKGKKSKKEDAGKRSISGKQDTSSTGTAAGSRGDKSQLKTIASVGIVVQSCSSHEVLDKVRPESRTTDRLDSEDTKKSKKRRRNTTDFTHGKIPEENNRGFSDADLFLQQHFRTFDKTFKDISSIVQYWDRTKLIVTQSWSQEGAVVPAPSAEEGINNLSRDKAPQSMKKGSKKEREKERQERLEKERIEKEKAVKLEKEKADREKQEGESLEDQARGWDGIGVPHLQLDANDPDNPCHKYILGLNRLPPVDEVLNGLGLGAKGPPIPPPALFSVIPYPVKRKPPSSDPSSHFEFIATSLDDPNAVIDDSVMKELEPHQEDTVSTDLTRSDSKREDHVSSQGKDRKKKDAKYDGSKSPSLRRSSPRKNRRSSVEGAKSPPLSSTTGADADQINTMVETITEFKPLKLSHFRWIVPAYSEVTIRIYFNSNDLGQFDQTMNFELTGTRRRYQLFCRGVCAFPTISREPKIVFPHRKKTKNVADDLISKKYILEEEFFEFGPLLCGKTRERYKDGKYPENMEKINILNTSPLLANINFCYQHDSNATTFLLDPPNMILEPAESKLLWIWAYPKAAGRFVDTIVCCVRENPEPICFNVACFGVRPELEIDRKHLHFDKILLHRKDSRSLYLRNSTMLPVAWHVTGMENLGDDFSLNQESGIVEPRCEFALQLNFRATKASNIKKAIRLEVLDAGNIMGLVQTENIQVTAEAYDVALDMSFPKGADGGLDFGSLRVQDETKQTCSLKNKGKYEIGFNFKFDGAPPGCPPVNTLFSVLPQKGTLIPNDRPTIIQVIFRCQSEISIRDVSLLKCNIVEPTIADGKEIVASIPVRISVRSVFSKYVIFPNTDINFGPMLLNSKKTRTFTIENKGEFDFKYVITKMIREAPPIRPRPVVVSGKRGKSKDTSASRSVAKMGRATFTRQEFGNNPTRVPVGCFTVYPGFGTVLPGAVQNVNIDCLAESIEQNEEFLSIDITDRDPDDSPAGIPYRVLAEGCMPNINTTDIASIFEEHRVCKNLSVYLQNKTVLEGNGVYGEEDNRFLFCNVVVGKKSFARFKISNTNKIAVDVAILVKPISNKVSARIHDIFDVDVSKTQIPPHGFIFVTVTFSPPAMHAYLCNFEACVDGLPPTLRQRSLAFEICGEGNLPRVTVSRPMLRNKHGEPVLLFQRQLVNRIETLSLVLTNEGTFPSKVNLILEQHAEPESDSDLHIAESKLSSTGCEKVFNLIMHPDAKIYMPVTLPGLTDHFPYTASVILGPDESTEFDVIFKPSRAQVFTGQIVIKTVNNQFEEHKVQLYGEGFKDDITFDNLHVDGDMAALVGDDGVLDMDVLSQQLSADSSQTSLGNLAATISFGDCDVGVPKTRTLAISNHSTSDTLRFKFDEQPSLKFSPSTGHLHPGTSKELTVTFNNDQPSDVKKTIVKCNVSKILFALPIDQVADWDDRMQTVKWTDVVDPLKPLGKCIKKKVVETEVEPDHAVVEESTRHLELIVLAKVDYTKYICDTNAITFKDTLMFQTRVYEFTLKNEGTVDLHYVWQLFIEGLGSGSSFGEGRPATATYSARGVGVESSLRSIIDDSMMPFSIAPAEGKIEPGQKQILSVRFSPTEVAEFHARLLCSVENLDPDQDGPSIKLEGRGQMPYCHFELEDSDYISSSRRNPDHPGPGGAPPGSTLDPNMKVIEFNPIGVDANSEKKFRIMNPTSTSYSFRWICLDIPDARNPSKFVCKVKEGELLSGKKLEMSFVFKPSNLEVCESFWNFIIPDNKLSIPFLLVGCASEPQVALSSTHINFNSILIGRTETNTVYLINNEPISFMYEVLDQSCYSEAHSTKIDVSPLKGCLPSNTRLPLQISFTATITEDSNFNVLVKVSKKTKPISLNVKGSGHKLNVQLLCENSLGHKIELSPAGLNAINLGEIEVHEKAIRQLHLVNPGQHNLAFHWKISSQELRVPKKPAMTIIPDSGIVTAGSRKRCILTFQATKVGSMPMHDLSLKVTEGPSYLCHVAAVGVNPSVKFSTKLCDFGPCFVYKAGMPLNTATVHITNKDRKEISVECLYQSTSHLEVNFYATLLAPRKSAFAHLVFYPRDKVAYNETVTFLVNGLSKHDVQVKGEGTEMRVEVVNAKQKQINFGALRVGQTVRHSVPIINRSLSAITLTLSLTPVMQALNNRSVLKLFPTEPFILYGKGDTKIVELCFSPKKRIPVFTEEIMMECAGMSQPLFIVTGSCQGIQITLGQSSVPFGAVVQGSQSQRRFTMQNSGDIGAGFKWDAKKLAPDFSIYPDAGYISPSMEVSFTVTFHPRELSQDIRYEGIKCQIEGDKPLSLTLTGMCIGAPPLREVISFNCHVRARDVKNVTISNRSNQKWRLQPVIDGDYWSGPDAFTVEPQQSKPFELAYRPLTMTQDGRKHQGSLFFALPDGTGLLYNLQGLSEAPKALATLSKDVPCKTSYTELLPITNWLRKPQRFKVITEMIKPEKLDPGTTLKGLDYIDVPGSIKKDYKLNFFAHKEGTFSAKVLFRNERTGEYLFYLVNFRATPPGVVGTIELITPVRRTALHTLKVNNPLPYPMSFQTDCRVLDVNIPTQFTVPPNSEGTCMFEYQPLKVLDGYGKLTLTNNDLGYYTYDLVLKATPGGPEKMTYFKTTLGCNHVISIKFQNFARQKTEYVCKVDNSEWMCERSITAAPASSATGTEVTVDVTYEPVNLGQSQATLVLTSVIGGEYTFPLQGRCDPPKPQGPFVVKHKSTTSVSFRNIFPTTTQYFLQVDNPLFTVKPTESIRPKKSHNITVMFDGHSQPGSIITGKLTLTCIRPASGTTSWVFYLKGVTPEQTLL